MIMPFLGGFRDPRVGLRNIQSNKVIVPPDYGNDASKAIPSTRGGDLATSSLSYDELKAKLLKEGRLFEDPDFPATDRSLYYSQRPPRQIQWLRPSVSFVQYFDFVHSLARNEMNTSFKWVDRWPHGECLFSRNSPRSFRMKFCSFIASIR